MKLAGVAKTHVERYEAATEAADLRAAEAKRALQDVKPWDELDKKRPGWALEDAAREAEVGQSTALAAAVQSYGRRWATTRSRRRRAAGWRICTTGASSDAERQRDEASRRFQEAMVQAVRRRCATRRC